MNQKFGNVAFFALILFLGLSFGAGTALARETEIRTDRATNIGHSSATFNGFVDTNDDREVYVWFEWDTSSSRFSQDTGQYFVGRTSGDDFAFNINNLRADTTYYFRAVAENEDGDIFHGDRRSFRTDEDDFNDGDRFCDTYGCYFYDDGSSSTSRPRVTTNPAIVPLDSAGYAVLSGYVDTRGENTIRWFEWGTRRDYLPFSTIRLSQSNMPGNFIQALPGLQPNVTYFYRAVAQSVGNPVYGQVLTFTVRGTPTPAYVPPASVPPVITPTVTPVPTVTIPIKINPVYETPVTIPVPIPVPQTPEEIPEEPQETDGSLSGAAILFGEGFFPGTLIGWIFLLLLVVLLVFVVQRAFGGLKLTNSKTKTHTSVTHHDSHTQGHEF